MARFTILSRHPSHKELRKQLKLRYPYPSVVRFGSTTELQPNRNRVEINSVESIETSSNKKLMKESFIEAKIKTAPYVFCSNMNEVSQKLKDEEIRFPLVAKSLMGSRGIGNTLLKDYNDLIKWSSNSRDTKKYIFENYVNYALEYRLHITKSGCFYTCRKALRKNTAKEDKWRRHVDNSVWFLEDNEKFMKPNSWDDIIKSCVTALDKIGADILSFDVRVQSDTTPKGKKRKYQDFILIECNSASSMKSQGDDLSICLQRYMQVLPNLIELKRIEMLDSRG